MRVFIPDELTDKYQVIANAQNRKLEQVIHLQLERFVRLPPGNPSMVIGREILDRITAVTGGIPVKDEADLLARFNRLAGISFKKINIDLSPAQLESLEARAKRQGRPIKALIQEIWGRVREEFNLATTGAT